MYGGEKSLRNNLKKRRYDKILQLLGSRECIIAVIRFMDKNGFFVVELLLQGAVISEKH